jgi:hypothetical protein
MKILWMTSLRPMMVSKSNDLIQDNFLNSIISLQSNIEFSFTQFDEFGVEDFISSKKIKNFYTNVSKSSLPPKKKYSNKIMLINALKEFLNNDFTHLVYSTADIIVPSNLIYNLEKLNKTNNNYCALIFPNILCKNGELKSTFWPHYGIDLFVFKLSKEKARQFENIIHSWDQYDWGINDNFYVAACEALNLNIYNMYKNSSIIKYENNFTDFEEGDNWRALSWNENKKYFKNFLKANNISLNYSRLSYYFILLKIFSFRDLSFRLFMSYLIFYSYFPIKKICDTIVKKFSKSNHN